MSANPLAPLYGGVYGPLYFGTLMSTGLYGVTCMQTFFYYVHYPNDSLRMKYFVAALWAFDTIHEALTIAGVYKYIMAGLVSPLGILDEVPELAILSAAMVSMPTQGFFVYRIYVFGGKSIVPPILWAIQMIYQIVAALLFVAKSLYSVDGSVHVVEFSVLNDSFFQDITISCLSLAAVVDVLIAIAMTFLLFRKRTDAAFKFASSTHVLQRLTVFAVNTGIWTATFAVLSIVLLRALPATNLLYLVFAIPLASVYSNALLANLNARAYIRSQATTRNGGADLVMMISPVSSGTKAETQSEDTKLNSSTNLDIRKTTEVVTFMDADAFTTPGNAV